MSEWHKLELSEIAKCAGKEMTVDIETTGIHFWESQTIGVGIVCPEAGVSGYFPTFNQSEREEIRSAILELSNTDTSFIAHNLKFELHFLNIDPNLYKFNFYDTADMVHIVDSRYKKSLALCEKEWFGENTKSNFIDKAPKSSKNKIWTWSIDLVAPYCINDCRVEHNLYLKLRPILEEQGQWKLFLKDMKYLGVVWDSEHYGFQVNPDFIVEAMGRMDEHISTLERELYNACGYTFNWRSPKQLSEALYSNLGIPKPKNPYADADGVDRSKFADKGLYKSHCTSTFILMEKVHHPQGVLVSQLREAAILKNTLKKWLELRDKDSIIHGNFNLTGTRTGRLSSTEPNLQNIASEYRTRYTQSVYSGEQVIRSEEFNLRNAFIARPGHTLISTDYKQMEMRYFGIASKDPFMLDSLTAGRDIHADIAEQVWGVRDSVHREWSKTISFGLIYGMSAGSLMHRLNMTYTEAKAVTQQYWDTFPRIQPWIQDTIDECKDFGYIRYWSNRRWYEEDPVHMYKGANALIQGGCADVLSIAAIRVFKWMRENIGEDSHIVNYIHDELLVEVPDEWVDRAIIAMRDLMAVEDLFNIVWITSTKVGGSYGTMDDIEYADIEAKINESNTEASV